jgi:abortive infection bacteriophage resistance protein
MRCILFSTTSSIKVRHLAHVTRLIKIFRKKLKLFCKLQKDIIFALTVLATLKSERNAYQGGSFAFIYSPWKTLELTSFGSLSKLYGNLKNTIKSKDTIASELGAVNHTYLPSWLQSIAQIRNYCAHHSRLWNKNLPGTPKLLSKPPYKWVNDVPKDTTRLYLHLCIMRYMVNIIAPENSFSIKLQELMIKYPSIDPNALGMKSDWKNEPLWK